jgi:hypothetical protein
MEREALKLALEAFETLTQYNMVRANIFCRFEPTCTGDYVDLREFREKAKPAITAIKEALAQPAQEPIGELVIMDEGEFEFGFTDDYIYRRMPELEKGTHKLYTAPPAQPAQEPFGWYSAQEDDFMTDKIRKEHERLNSFTYMTGKFDLALYTTPPKREWEEWNAALDEVALRIGEIKGFGQATQDSFAVFIQGLKK